MNRIQCFLKTQKWQLSLTGRCQARMNIRFLVCERWIWFISAVWEYSIPLFGGFCCSVASLVWVFVAPLSFTISWSLLRFMSGEPVMLFNHLILCRPFLLLPSIFASIRVFSNELALHIRWPEYWSFHYSIRPFNGSRYWCIGGRIGAGRVDAS